VLHFLVMQGVPVSCAVLSVERVTHSAALFDREPALLFMQGVPAQHASHH